MKEIQRFQNSFNKYGARFTIFRTIEHISNMLKYKNRLISNNPVIAGILLEKILCGPETVQLDITNDCNSSCIGCWLHSPLLGKEKVRGVEKKRHMPTDKILETIKQLRKLGTKNITLSGGGEPFMHPDIMKVIEAIKKSGFKLTVITNFNLLTKEQIRRLVNSNINELFISVWAGNPETYVKTHPNQTNKSFERLKENIKFLTSIIHEENKPRVLLLNVISDVNYKELDNIIKFGLEVKANGVEFTLIDTIKNKTELLLLNKEQKEFLIKKVSQYYKKMNEKNVYHPSKDKSIEIFGLDRFKARLENKRLSEGFYDKKLVDSIPCYAGYSYARIMADGKVIPCCKAHKHSLGNINEKSFKEIWFADKYEEFRITAKNVKKSHPYFSKINCYKGCDNYIENKRIDSLITILPSADKKALMKND